MKRLYFATVIAACAVSLYFAGPRDIAFASAKPTPLPTATPKPVVSSPPKPLITPTPSPKPTEDDEPITINVQTVNLNVRVVDRNNRPINNLQQKDFKVLEDGVPQEIDSFSKAEMPTNYAMVVDNSGSIAPQLEKVIEAGNIFINTNRPADETMVIRFVGRDKIEVLQPFTSNKADLLDSLDQFYKEGGQTAIIDALYLAIESVDDYEKSKDPANQKRRAIILVTDGEDRNSYYNEKQLFDLLRESEVQIYAIGFVDDLSKDGGFISKSPQAKAKAFLERIAADSGGKAYFPGSAAELPNLAKEISNELRTQYAISYTPTNDKKDGAFHQIRVVVPDGPNKEKRVAITRAGRTSEGGPSTAPSKPAAPSTAVKNP